MAICTSCGYDVTGKKFCQQCGTPVQLTGVPTPTNLATPLSNPCPRCNEHVNPGAPFSNRGGSALQTPVPATLWPASVPTTTSISTTVPSAGTTRHGVSTTTYDGPATHGLALPRLYGYGPAGYNKLCQLSHQPCRDRAYGS